MRRFSTFLRPRSALLLVLLMLPGCNALNPLCGSSRPAPSISSLSDSTATFTQVEQGFPLTVNGSQFVSSSVVLVNGTAVATQVVSSQELQITVTTAVISGPGRANVSVNTPSGNTGYAGCDSGGTSDTLVLTVF